MTRNTNTRKYHTPGTISFYFGHNIVTRMINGWMQKALGRHLLPSASALRKQTWCLTNGYITCFGIESNDFPSPKAGYPQFAICVGAHAVRVALSVRLTGDCSPLISLKWVRRQDYYTCAEYTDPRVKIRSPLSVLHWLICVFSDEGVFFKPIC